MNYTTSQAADLLTLCQNYANVNSSNPNSEGCYIIREEKWRSVISKGCYTLTFKSAIKDALSKAKDKNELKGSTVFVTKQPSIDEIDMLNDYNVKQLIYPGQRKERKYKDISIFEISKWKKNT